MKKREKGFEEFFSCNDCDPDILLETMGIYVSVLKRALTIDCFEDCLKKLRDSHAERDFDSYYVNYVGKRYFILKHTEKLVDKCYYYVSEYPEKCKDLASLKASLSRSIEFFESYIKDLYDYVYKPNRYDEFESFLLKNKDVDMSQFYVWVLDSIEHIDNNIKDNTIDDIVSFLFDRKCCFDDNHRREACTLIKNLIHSYDYETHYCFINQPTLEIHHVYTRRDVIFLFFVLKGLSKWIYGKRKRI